MYVCMYVRCEILTFLYKRESSGNPFMETAFSKKASNNFFCNLLILMGDQLT